MRALIWTKNNCSFCVKAKELLQSSSISFEERNIDTNYSKVELLEMVPHARTVPQIFIDNIYIGGYTDLVEYLNTL
jgi:glutaredoxin 3